MLNWLQQFNIFCLLDNRGYNPDESAFECLAAAGKEYSLRASAGNAWAQLQAFCEAHPQDWIFGHLGYDLKNEIPGLRSSHPNETGFDDLHFFIPEIILQLSPTEITITGAADAAGIKREIDAQPATLPETHHPPLTLQSRITRDQYLSLVGALQRHIHRGDCYEINFCQEFFADNCGLDPLAVYEKLVRLSPNPFSAFYRVNDAWCCCASPERYLRKNGQSLLSQPIKGTSKRDLSNPEQDERNRLYLLESQKERSENVMVVDLVRNDLSRVCEPGSVKVDELFGLYSFPQVHQMISSVSGQLAAGFHPVEALRQSFPMGSMTGAPKIRVMQLIEEYEQSRRGLFSGAIGYFRPGRVQHDFDFNVIIRSLFYHQSRQFASFQVGGGITFNSIPEEEYEECLLKASAMLKVLQ